MPRPALTFEDLFITPGSPIRILRTTAAHACTESAVFRPAAMIHGRSRSATHWMSPSMTSSSFHRRCSSRQDAFSAPPTTFDQPAQAVHSITAKASARMGDALNSPPLPHLATHVSLLSPPVPAYLDTHHRRAFISMFRQSTHVANPRNDIHMVHKTRYNNCLSSVDPGYFLHGASRLILRSQNLVYRRL
ncbi:hypothetical protein EJ03DRAFT_77083 [Teratosphaeria nubilosa]|uniref:Uncharacterized protein n=1 Tax=Teratosphaeria nubilosa TaxID=161662 RepID=A0A6G1LBL1_9PEZI|nr:hypothetical protein EJ03DRAFT_77083 [Teratosphaeria nubilosa]